MITEEVTSTQLVWDQMIRLEGLLRRLDRLVDCRDLEDEEEGLVGLVVEDWEEQVVCIRPLMIPFSRGPVEAMRVMEDMMIKRRRGLGGILLVREGRRGLGGIDLVVTVAEGGALGEVDLVEGGLVGLEGILSD